MANKYELRRRAIKDTQSRGENPYASPRSWLGGRQDDFVPPAPLGSLGLTAVLCLGLAALVVALYLQTVTHKFTLADVPAEAAPAYPPEVQPCGHRFTVCDDNVYIYKTPMVVRGVTWDGIKWAMGDAHAGNWHPLTWMSHMLDCQLFGHWDEETNVYVWDPMRPDYTKSWPGGHHMVSMLIHAANVVLLFLALRLMTGTLWPALAVAAVFAAHPLRVESVAWAAERKDVLCGLFWMATLVAYGAYSRKVRFQLDSLTLYGVISAIIAFFALLFIPMCMKSDHIDWWYRLLGVALAFLIIGVVVYSAVVARIHLLIYCAVVLFFMLGLMAKSMIVSLPCVLLLLDVWPLDRWRKAIRPADGNGGGPDLGAIFFLVLEKVPLFGLAAVDSWITVYGQHKGVALNSFEGLPLGARVLNAILGYGEYIRQTFWPSGMAPFYCHPHMIPNGWTTEVYVKIAIYGALMAVVTAAAVAAMALRWRWSFLAVGWFWYLGALVPVIGILQVGTQGRADRYTYLPMIGFYIMVAWLIKAAADRWPQCRMPLAAGSAAVLVILSAITYRQVGYWANSYKLFEHTVKVTDQNYFGWNHIGIQFDEDGIKTMRSDAVAGQKMLDKSAEAFANAIAIKPDYDFGNNNLGVYYARKGEHRTADMMQSLQLAERYFRFALKANYRYADAYNNLGIVLARQGNFKEAIQSHLMGLQIQYDRASDHNNLGQAYEQDRQIDNAEREYQLALTFDPNFIGAWFNLGRLYVNKKELDKAIDCFIHMTKIDPTSADAFNSLGILFYEKGDLRSATRALEEALRLNPNYPDARARLEAVKTEAARRGIK